MPVAGVDSGIYDSLEDLLEDAPPGAGVLDSSGQAVIHGAGDVPMELVADAEPGSSDTTGHLVAKAAAEQEGKSTSGMFNGLGICQTSARLQTCSTHITGSRSQSWP